MSRSIIGLGLVLLVTGCAKLEVASITEIKPGPGAVGLDVYAGRRQTGEPVPAFAGEQIVEIRSISPDYTNPETSTREFAGATCEVSASNFTATVVTPAKLRVPIYGQATSPLALQCTKSGFRPKLTTIAVQNVSRSQRMGMGASGGVIGVAAALVAEGMSNPANDEYKYQPIFVELDMERPGQKVAEASRAQ
jgi:hypothetical protein